MSPPCRRRYRHIYDGAEGAVPPQWNGTSYLPRAEPSIRPGGVSWSRTEPWQPRAKGPAAGSTLTPVRACQPSGILESTAQVPISTAPKAPEPSSPSGLVHKKSALRIWVSMSYGMISILVISRCPHSVEHGRKKDCRVFCLCSLFPVSIYRRRVLCFSGRWP